MVGLSVCLSVDLASTRGAFVSMALATKDQCDYHNDWKDKLGWVASQSDDENSVISNCEHNDIVTSNQPVHNRRDRRVISEGQ